MENKKKLFYYLVFVMFVIMICGCRQGSNPIFDVPSEVIDFYSFEIHENEYIPNELIQEKTYIKLDASTDDALFKCINKILIVGNKIYILDGSRSVQKLLVFNIDGSFEGLVGRRGQGPGEYLQVTDFDVSTNGSIHIVDGQSDRLFIFDSVFHFVSVKKIPFEVGIIQLLSDNQYLLGLSSWNMGETWKVAITTTDFEPLDKCLPYDEYYDNNMWISGYNFMQTENHILYNKQINNNVYAFSHDGKLEKIYQFDFGKKNVPNEYKKDIEKNWEGFRFRCCLKCFVIVNEHYCIGTLLDELQTKTFIIDRNSDNLYISKEIAERDYSYLTGYHNNQIITYIYPGKYENIQSEDLPEDVKKYVEDENFVLCLYKLK
ncbi:MAG: 6-bladed beta-propeller [Prevotellaceae bacterium]|jgi:hypothetical protein|nr:6-bladed beta-propeller [Prevotellaceae bacterium]